MEIDKHSPRFLAAIRDFRRARQRAVLENIVANLTGKSADLLAYNEVREQLKAGEPVDRGLQRIPLDAIVGSVGRCTDFTRSFLPRQKKAEERWAQVRARVTDVEEMPPILVYQLGQVYFVLDGNHRVSVARQLGATHIPAYVTEIQTDVPLQPGVQPDELIAKAQYANFLEQTGLHDLRPEADLSVSLPGPYRILKEQIGIHHNWLRQQAGREVPYAEAVEHWYDDIYLPIIRIIRQRGILRHFPGRTETDLYGWIFQHQAELKEALGWEVDPETVAEDLVTRFSLKPQQVIARLKEKVLDALTPDPFEAGPPPGQWRQEHLAHQTEHLFNETLCLVPVRDGIVNWRAFRQALRVAQQEDGRLHGLHVVSTTAEKESQQAQAMQAEFAERCQVAGVEGELSLDVGSVPRQVCERARWVDLIVICLSQPPGPHPGDRLSSGFGTIVRRCAKPVLAVPGNWSPLDRALLAYDGSPKASEALFVATYLAGHWQIPLTVVTVLEQGQTTSKTLTEAQEYLAARGVAATFVAEQGNVAEVIQQTAEAHQSNLIIMGGYGFNPLLEVVLGSAVDEVLQARRWPVLICR